MIMVTLIYKCWYNDNWTCIRTQKLNLYKYNNSTNFFFTFLLHNINISVDVMIIKLVYVHKNWPLINYNIIILTCMLKITLSKKIKN